MRPKCWDQKCIYTFDILQHPASETSASKKTKKLSANMCVCVGVTNERPAQFGFLMDEA